MRRKLLRLLTALALLVGLIVPATIFATSASASASLPYYPNYPQAALQGYDLPVPADYNGDGYWDAAYVKNNGSYYEWHIRGMSTVNFGSPGDIPVPGDYRLALYWATGATWGPYGGQAEPAVFRPSTHTFYVSSPYGGTYTFSYGDGDFLPVPGDYNGGSNYGPQMTFGVWDPHNSSLYYIGTNGATQTANWASLTTPPSGDYVFTVYRPYEFSNTGTSLGGLSPTPAKLGETINRSVETYCTPSPYPAPCNTAIAYGDADMQPFTYDWGYRCLNGGCTSVQSHIDSVSLFRNGFWAIRNPTPSVTNTTAYSNYYGQQGDYPVAGPWNGSHSGGMGGSFNAWTNEAVYRPCNATWYINGKDPGQVGSSFTFGDAFGSC